LDTKLTGKARCQRRVEVGAKRRRLTSMQRVTAICLFIPALVAVFAPAAQPDALIARRELLAVNSAGSQVLLLRFVDADDAPPPSQEPNDYRVNGGKPLHVGRYSATIYEERCTDWRAQRYPQAVSHQMYLFLDSPLTEGSGYHLQFPGGETNLVFRAAEVPCDAFKVNQVGYSRVGEKRAAFFAPWYGDASGRSNPPPPTAFLCSADTGRELRTIPLTSTSNDNRNGGPVWRIELSSLDADGEFFLKMPGVGRSATFGFGNRWAHHAFYAHLKGFYHQRCGTALHKPFTEWERAACHTSLEVTDATPPGFIKEHGPTRRRSPGGHHDAGDFDVRLSHTAVAGWLLNAFELFPGKFTDGQLDIPESENGIPDLLDEALYSIAAWEDLQEEDGGIRAGFEADRHPTYGEVTAATDRLAYRTYARHGHTTLAGCALMAYASRLVQPFDARRASALLKRAQRAWAFYEANRENPKFRWSRGTLMFATCQLYAATGTEKYHDIFKHEARYFFNLDGQKSAWPAQYHGTYFNLETIEQGTAFTHYFASYLLMQNRPVDTRIGEAARRAVLQKADEHLTKLAGGGFATISTGSWGASTGVGRYGDFLIHAWKLTGETKYRDAAAQLADWVLGANPPGWCFTTGLGSRPPNNPLQLDSYPHAHEGRGPVPGIVIYGITDPPGASAYIKAVTQHMHPAMETLPAARRLTDGWSVVAQNEFTVWETMAPNAFLFACLAPDKPLKGQLLPWTARSDLRRVQGVTAR
jgi:endoglucanase